jgi:hypothetical protein
MRTSGRTWAGSGAHFWVGLGPRRALGPRLALPLTWRRLEMPEKRTIARARRAARQGKAASTVAGEFVREEIDHVRAGKHGARSPKQAIAIGLSKARRAGVRLPAPKRGQASSKVRQQAERDLARAKHPRPVSRKRASGVKRALRREGQEAASPRALAYQARTSCPQKKSAPKTARRTSSKSPSKQRGRQRATRKNATRKNATKRRTQ